MTTVSTFLCRWDWCRASLPSIDALDTHVKHEHIWPMKPMQKEEIALMRRMDLQSLHSSPDTDSSIISGGLIAGVSRNKTPPLAPSTPETQEPLDNDVFDTFARLSSPQIHSPQRLPVSPAFEGLIKQDGHSGLSAAVEMFDRKNGRKATQRLRLPSHQRSPTHRPLSQSSSSSQEVVEQHLTQEDDVGPQPEPEQQIENELANAELRWPTDDESDAVATEGIQNSGQPVSKQKYRSGSSFVSAKGRNFRYGSLNVSLGVNSRSASPASQGSRSQSQPIVLQTQAPYSSQAWSQTQ